ncbi:MAG: CCA tRNA nucleotidyltransferase [Elusimicrobia bacterium]|nr:CCA tRNA nucleotidyltransferase [Elusimicrobiota bacterium]
MLSNMLIRFPMELQEVLGPLAAEARRARLPLYAVGGCVRDWMLGAPTKDLDFVTESDPLPLIRFCSRKWGGTTERFDSFKTVRCNISSGLRLDFVRARSERYPQPAALPVVRAAGLSEDLARRDFSVNAMAVAVRSADSGELIDPQRGWGDLKRRLLRVLHPLSFRDDPTRMFRAARYACRYRLRLEAGTESLRRDALKAGYALRLSRERARNELVRILEERDPVCALRTIKAWKLSDLLHERLAWPKNIAEGGGSWERLGMIALHLQGSSRASEASEDGLGFVRSLRLERQISRPIEEALRVCARRAAPRERPDPLTRRLIVLMRARLSPAALQPVLISGRDLQGLGLKPGPRYQRILDRAARAQWRGKFADRPQALRWLKVNFPA